MLCCSIAKKCLLSIPTSHTWETSQADKIPHAFPEDLEPPAIPAALQLSETLIVYPSFRKFAERWPPSVTGYYKVKNPLHPVITGAAHVPPARLTTPATPATPVTSVAWWSEAWGKQSPAHPVIASEAHVPSEAWGKQSPSPMLSLRAKRSNLLVWMGIASSLRSSQ